MTIGKADIGISGINSSSEAEERKDIRLEYSFSPEHPIFIAHFPSEPLVPAYMQLQLVRQLLASSVETPLERIRFNNVKFLSRIRPGIKITVEIAKKSDNGFLFKILGTDGIVSTGHITKG